MELNFSRNGLCVWSFGSVYCCNAVVERILHRQLLIGSTLVSLLQKCVNLLVLLTVQMDQIFWICYVDDLCGHSIDLKDFPQGMVYALSQKLP